MSDLIIYTTLASSIFVILFIIAIFRKKFTAESETQEIIQPPRSVPVEPHAGRLAGRRNVRSRLHGYSRPSADEEEERAIVEAAAARISDDDDNDDGDGVDVPSLANKQSLQKDKLGAKKRKKLEMKAEKKTSREQEQRAREEQRKKRDELQEQWKQDDKAARAEQTAQEEAERLRKEEEARQEHEAYLKLKEAIEVETEGFDQEDGGIESEDLLKKFIQHIKDEKVVILEDLAATFKLKTKDAINRINALMESGDLTGVTDDRGKFIYISMDELKAVAKFIRQRGRVTISELAECSNTLINMNPMRRVAA